MFHQHCWRVKRIVTVSDNVLCTGTDSAICCREEREKVKSMSMKQTSHDYYLVGTPPRAELRVLHTYKHRVLYREKGALYATF